MGYPPPACQTSQPVIRSNFGPRAVQLRQHLRAMRQQAGLTQAALAARLNRTQQWVYKCESGERRLDVLEFMEIADAIGFDPADFLTSLRKEAPPLDASPRCDTQRRRPGSSNKPTR